jgi:RHS repeat-associated protein
MWVFCTLALLSILGEAVPPTAAFIAVQAAGRICSGVGGVRMLFSAAVRRARVLVVGAVLAVLVGGGWLGVGPVQPADAQPSGQAAASHVPKPAAPQKALSLRQRREQFGGLPKGLAAHALPTKKAKAPSLRQAAAIDKHLRSAQAGRAQSAGPATPAGDISYDGLVTWQMAQDPLGGETAYDTNGSCCSQLGVAVPGESLSESAEIYQTGPNVTTQEPHSVKVTWKLRDYCTNGPDQIFDFGQTVTAPNWWAHTLPDAPAAPVVSALLSLPSTGCDPDSLWQYEIWTCTQVTDAQPNPTGCGLHNTFVVLPFLSADATHGCVCGDASGAPRSEAMRGDPVNTATGAYSENFSDASVAGMGVTFTVARSYGSDVTAVGVLGKGWSLPWETSLSIDSAGNVLLHGEGGALHEYTKNSDGSFTPADGGTSVLVSDGSSFTLTSLDHRVYTFNASGRLTSEKDASGQGLTLQYSAGVVTSITDAAGRVVSLAYSGGFLSTITLADGRHVGYGYTDGRLASVTALDGTTSKYGYDAAGRLESVTDALGHRQVFNVYDGQGRVSSQLDATGRETDFAYTTTSVFSETDTTAPDGGVWSDFYAGNMLYAQLDPFGNRTQYGYDKHYNRTQLVDGNGHETDWVYNDDGLLKSKSMDGLENWTYDSAGNPATYEDANDHTTTFTYGSDHLLSSVEDALLHTSSYTYWPNGELKSATTPLQYTTQYAYFTDGSLKSVTTPEGRTTSYTYDVAGRLKTVTDPRGNVSGADPARFTTTYGYDDADRVTSVTDANGHVTTTAYDLAGNIHTVTDPAGRITSYDYDAANRLDKITDPAGHAISYGFDAAGRQNSVTDRTLAVTTTSYNKAGEIASMVTARGNVTGANKAAYTWTYGYDRAGNRTSTSDPQGHTTIFGYDDINRPTSITDPNGHTRRVTYDHVGNVASYIDALTDKVSLSYDSDNRLIGSKNERGNSTTYAFDNDGNLIGQISPLGEHTTYGYDKDGLRTTAVDPRGNLSGANPTAYTWTTDYDPAGQPISETDPMGNVTQTGYDGVGNVVSTTDARQKTATTSYDELDRVKSTIAADGGETDYTYDPATGFLLTVEDPNTHVTTYGHDNEGRTTSVKDPLNRTVSVAYDAEGNISKTTNARGQSITATIDARDLTNKLTYSDGTPTVSYTYDNAGRLQAVADATGTRTLTYFDNDKLQSISSPGATQPFKYTYYADGSVSTRTYPDGTSTSFGYDSDGRITGETTSGKTVSYTYDPAGNQTSEAFPTTTTAVAQYRGYDADGRVNCYAAKDICGKASQGGYMSIGYDADGHVSFTHENAGLVFKPTHRYDYDDAGRLTRSCDDPTGSNCLTTNLGDTYVYDKAGNAKSSTNVVGSTTTTTTNTYDAADELSKSVTGSTSTNYAYDADGNQTQAGTTTYAYDAAGRVTSSTTGTTTSAFTYDADGNRSTVKTNGALADTLRWDVNNPLPQIATETDGSGSLIGDYQYTPQGVPQSLNRSSTAFYYLLDQQNSVTGVDDSTGASNYHYSYGTYGTPAGTQDVTGGQQSAFGFTGQYKDPYLAGHLDLRDRTLDTTTGRFTTRDPIAPPVGSPNPSAYAYADNEPTTLDDPSGDCPPCAALIGAGVGGLVSGGIYAWQHRDGGWDWSDFAMATGKGAIIGAGAGLLLPVGGAGAAFLGFEEGTASYLATSAFINGVVNAGYTAAIDAATCQPFTPQDLLFGFAGGFLGGYADYYGTAALRWLTGFGRQSPGADAWYETTRAVNRARALGTETSNGSLSSRQRPKIATAYVNGDYSTSGTSVKGKAKSAFRPHPDVEAAYDQVPKELRGRGHGYCGEVVCLSNALNDGVDTNGGHIVSVLIQSDASSADQGILIRPCSSCQWVLDHHLPDIKVIKK